MNLEEHSPLNQWQWDEDDIHSFVKDGVEQTTNDVLLALNSLQQQANQWHYLEGAEDDPICANDWVLMPDKGLPISRQKAADLLNSLQQQLEAAQQLPKHGWIPNLLIDHDAPICEVCEQGMEAHEDEALITQEFFRIKEELEAALAERDILRAAYDELTETVTLNPALNPDGLESRLADTEEESGKVGMALMYVDAEGDNQVVTADLVPQAVLDRLADTERKLAGAREALQVWVDMEDQHPKL